MSAAVILRKTTRDDPDNRGRVKYPAGRGCAPKPACRTSRTVSNEIDEPLSYNARMNRCRLWPPRCHPRAKT
jgi:hypothetical protein